MIPGQAVPVDCGKALTWELAEELVTVLEDDELDTGPDSVDELSEAEDDTDPVDNEFNCVDEPESDEEGPEMVYEDVFAKIENELDRDDESLELVEEAVDEAADGTEVMQVVKLPPPPLKTVHGSASHLFQAQGLDLSP